MTTDVVVVVADVTKAVVVLAEPDTVLSVASPARGPTGPAGPAGPPGPAGADSTVPGPPGPSFGQYVHTQILPATVWTVTHALGRFPAAVTVFSTDYSIEFGEFSVQHVDLNTLYLSADLPISGVALVT